MKRKTEEKNKTSKKQKQKEDEDEDTKEEGKLSNISDVIKHYASLKYGIRTDIDERNHYKKLFDKTNEKI